MKGAVSTIMMRVVHLVKNFGEFTAVGDISFEVAKGEIFAFLGPNGAGKTTTIKMLTTLLRPTSGRIELDGLDPVKDQNKARRLFGILFQDPSLDGDLTAYENMEIHGVLYHVPREERREGYLVQERSSGSFTRTINLPANFDANKVSSECSEGELRITLPKAAETRARRIEVKPSTMIEGHAEAAPKR